MAVSILCLFLTVPWAGLQRVIVTFPNHTDLLSDHMSSHSKAFKCWIYILSLNVYIILLHVHWSSIYSFSLDLTFFSGLLHICEEIRVVPMWRNVILLVHFSRRQHEECA